MVIFSPEKITGKNMVFLIFLFFNLLTLKKNYKSELKELILQYRIAPYAVDIWKINNIVHLLSGLWSLNKANRAYDYYKTLHTNRQKEIGHSDHVGKGLFNFQLIYVLYETLIYKKKIPKSQKKNLGNFFKELDRQIAAGIKKLGDFEYKKNFSDQYIWKTAKLPKSKRMIFKPVSPNINRPPTEKRLARRLQFEEDIPVVEHFHNEKNSIYLRNIFNLSTKFLFSIYLSRVYIVSNVFITAYLRVFYILLNLLFLY